MVLVAAAASLLTLSTAVAGPSARLPSTDPLGDPLAASPAPSRAARDASPSATCIFCRGYWTLLKGDVKHVFTSPGRWDGPTWHSVGWQALGVLGTMAALDQDTRTDIDSQRNATNDRIATDFQPFGRKYPIYVIGGYLLAGHLFHRPKARAVAVDAFTSTVIAAGLITPTLKLIVGRSRPRADLGPHDFHPFSGGYSFPSGHATAAFSLAATVAEHYNQLWVKGLSYSLASMVAYARMEKDAHYLSDVTAGAMIGIGVAHSVHAFNRGHRGSIAVSPIQEPGAPRPDGLRLSFEVAMR